MAFSNSLASLLRRLGSSVVQSPFFIGSGRSLAFLGPFSSPDRLAALPHRPQRQILSLSLYPAVVQMAGHPQMFCPILTFYLLRCPTLCPGHNGRLRQRPVNEEQHAVSGKFSGALLCH